ncbi:MAG: hypothetical protein AMXMBFR47_27520 [Planctomycetota bacterium]
MFGGNKLIRRPIVVASAAGIVSAVAAAADCKLSVHASPQVLYSGQSASVSVLAHFPTPPAPGGAYAFASSTFDVFATDPAWTFASAGAIVGNDVLGANVLQVHRPQLGVFADPSNPIRIWHGTFTPQSSAPALIEIEVDPTDFSVYPSKRTSSSVECDADGGSDFLFVNPLRVGSDWLAAPGRGTTMKIRDGVIEGQRMGAGDDVFQWDPGDGSDTVSVGITPIKTFYCPSEHGVDSSTRLAFDQPPSSFTAAVQVSGEKDSGAGDDQTEVYVKFELEDAMITSYAVSGGTGGDVQSTEGGIPFEVYLGGVRVASGDLSGDGQNPGLMVSDVPQTIGTHLLYQDTVTPAGVSQSGMTWTLRYDRPVVAIVLGPNGNPVPVTGDWIEVHSTQLGINRPTASQSPQPLGIGCHLFEAEGVRQMRITPKQSE